MHHAEGSLPKVLRNCFHSRVRGQYRHFTYLLSSAISLLCNISFAVFISIYPSHTLQLCRAHIFALFKAASSQIEVFLARNTDGAVACFSASLLTQSCIISLTLPLNSRSCGLHSAVPFNVPGTTGMRSVHITCVQCRSPGVVGTNGTNGAVNAVMIDMYSRDA